MQIVLHAGAHVTDESRLVKGLLRNAAALADRGIAVPPPSAYRGLLRNAAVAIGMGRLPGEDARRLLLDEFLASHHASLADSVPTGKGQDRPDPERLILSHENLFSLPSHAIDGGMFYRRAVERMTAIAQLFAGDRVELFLGLRNPASFLPALAAQADPVKFGAHLARTEVRDLRWSRLLTDLRKSLPAIDITVWANEDTPLIWGTLLREMAGIEPNVKIAGAFDLLAEIMTHEGMTRFRAYLKEHPVMTEIQKRRVISAFLDKFARPDMIEQVADLPGWTTDLVVELSETYEDDIYAIGRIPGVTLIAP